MIAKKIIGLTLLTSAGIYVAVQKFGKKKQPGTPVTATPAETMGATLPDYSNGGIVWNGSIDNLPGVIFVSTSDAPLNGLNLLN